MYVPQSPTWAHSSPEILVTFLFVPGCATPVFSLRLAELWEHTAKANSLQKISSHLFLLGCLQIGGYHEGHNNYADWDEGHSNYADGEVHVQQTSPVGTNGH